MIQHTIGFAQYKVLIVDSQYNNTEFLLYIPLPPRNFTVKSLKNNNHGRTRRRRFFKSPRRFGMRYRARALDRY
jgi:hypothetical protein